MDTQADATLEQTADETPVEDAVNTEPAETPKKRPLYRHPNVMRFLFTSFSPAWYVLYVTDGEVPKWRRGVVLVGFPIGALILRYYIKDKVKAKCEQQV